VVRLRSTRGTRDSASRRPVAGSARGCVPRPRSRLEPELPLGLGGQRVDVELHGQEVEPPQQAREVVHVAVDAACDARVLDLEREARARRASRRGAPADRCRATGSRSKRSEALLPALAVLPAEHRDAAACRASSSPGARSIASAAWKDSGNSSSLCSERIWPSFIAGPRRLARRLAQEIGVAGREDRGPRGSGPGRAAPAASPCRSPWPSASSPLSSPKRSTREKRDAGNRAALAGDIGGHRSVAPVA